MSENKYANIDVIRALKRCNFGKFENCEGGPGENIEYSSEEGGCCYILHQCALDLINRQRAEIERLTVELDAMRGAANSYKMHYENAKAEEANDVKEENKNG